jgi:hypothetical protein
MALAKSGCPGVGAKGLGEQPSHPAYRIGNNPQRARISIQEKMDKNSPAAGI